MRNYFELTDYLNKNPQYLQLFYKVYNNFLKGQNFFLGVVLVWLSKVCLSNDSIILIAQINQYGVTGKKVLPSILGKFVIGKPWVGSIMWGAGCCCK